MTCYIDERLGCVHLAGCAEITDECIAVEDPGNKFLLRKNQHYCSCMDGVRREARKIRNREVIANGKYKFVYTERSPVYHRCDCGIVLNASHTIYGAMHEDRCKEVGRRPCKVCCPSAGDSIYTPKKRRVTEAERWGRGLGKNEQRGLQRYYEARGERNSKNMGSFETVQERIDFKTLTNSRYAFFAEEGCRTFHLRDCKKIKGLMQLKGFAKYNQAMRAGYRPCRCCNPTKKHDIRCSVPITSQQRKYERVETIVSMCDYFGYSCSQEGTVFKVQTPVGKWKFDMGVKPYALHHINLMLTPNNEDDYHRQEYLFLSMRDVIQYIRKHEKSLLRYKSHQWPRKQPNNIEGETL